MEKIWKWWNFETSDIKINAPCSAHFIGSIPVVGLELEAWGVEGAGIRLGSEGGKAFWIIQQSHLLCVLTSLLL